MGYPGNSKHSSYPGSYAYNQQQQPQQQYQPPPSSGYSQNPYPLPPPYSNQPPTYAPSGGMPMPMPMPSAVYPDSGQGSTYASHAQQGYLSQAQQGYSPQAQQGYSSPMATPSSYPNNAYGSQPPPASQYAKTGQPSGDGTLGLGVGGGGGGGQKRALLIGINYTSSPTSQLKGCINDVQSMLAYLTQRAGFPRENIVVLTDDTNNPRCMPTRQNILSAMQQLSRGARPGDSLFFHFSGHGDRKVDTSGDEDDGFDETILPVDYKTAGMIVDDEIHKILVKPLPAGCRLTCVFDSCHSGTAMDLPYVYLPSGQLKKRKTHNEKMLSGASQAGMQFLQGNTAGAIKGLFSLLTPQKKIDHQKVEQDHQTQADVIQFSGCKDCQTSADAMIQGKFTGAMSWALLQSLTSNPSQTYSQLLTSTRALLATKYSQIPQLSSGKLLDMKQVFRL